MLSACSFHSKPPPFTASGYIANDGIVRIWRKDDNYGGSHLLMAFNPFNGVATTTSEYRWQGDKLTSLEINSAGTEPEQIKLRFDDAGNVSFMQRQFQGQKQQLSTDSIAMYRYRASRVKHTSDALRNGKIALYQGHWQQDGNVISCEGKTLSPSLDSLALQEISRQQRADRQGVSIAWLKAQEGTQLLLVTNEDICRTQPKPDDF